MADPLITATLHDVLDRLGSGAPTPGGGSASALGGATAAALVGMVLELGAGPGSAPDAGTHDDLRATATRLRRELTELIELDAAAYDAVVAARRRPRGTDDEVAARSAAIASATREATRVPVRIARAAGEVLALAERVAALGRRSAISDVGVAGELAAAALRGAVLNVRINLPGLPDDDPMRSEAGGEMWRLIEEADRRVIAIRDAVAERME